MVKEMLFKIFPNLALAAIVNSGEEHMRNFEMHLQKYSTYPLGQDHIKHCPSFDHAAEDAASNR